MSNADTASVSVLVDHSVLRHGVITQPATVQRSVRWGGRDETAGLAGWQRKPQLSPDQSWRRKQIECLPTVARLAREGAVALFSYNELGFEDWRGERGMCGTFGDLFTRVAIGKVSPAVERSRFQQTVDLREHIGKDALTEFCKFLIELDPSVLMQVPQFWDGLPEFEKDNLSRLDVFKELCRGLTENHYADAFHLWTGEANGLDFFVMVEKRFINAVRGTSRSRLRCEPVTPEELLQGLGVRKLDPMPFSDFGPHTYFD